MSEDVGPTSGEFPFDVASMLTFPGGFFLWPAWDVKVAGRVSNNSIDGIERYYKTGISFFLNDLYVEISFRKIRNTILTPT